MTPTKSTRKAESRLRHLVPHPSLSNMTTLSSTSPQNEVQASTGYYRMSSDISTMFSIKEKIEHLVELSIKVIIENDATPEIEQGFEPALRALEHSYPPFHKQGVHYFTTYCSMQESAKTNQVLSSAGVRIPLQTFTKDWKLLCGVIDHFTNLNPPPHAKEIAAKFKAVRASLDSIKKTNERRKHPTPGITNCITNILALGKSISKNIVDLFSQNFTDFGSNLYESLRRDVKSFLKVINEAFSNEFVQSGVMLCDLYRIRSNIFTDCNEIVESLKSAFVFPKEMQEIKILKDTTEGELKRIFEKLSVPFIIIKPIITEAASEMAPMDEEQHTFLDDNMPNFLERDEIVPQALPKQDYLAACNRIDEFAANIFQIIDHPIDYTRDTWDNLIEIKEIISNYKTQAEAQTMQIKSLQIEIKHLKEKNHDNEIIFSKKNEVLTKVNDVNAARLEKSESEYEKITRKCELQSKEIDNMSLKYSNLKAKGDAVEFRKSMIEIGKMVCPKARIELLKQDELMITVKKLVQDLVERPCEQCQILEAKLFSAKNDLISIMDKVRKMRKTLPKMEKITKNRIRVQKTHSRVAIPILSSPSASELNAAKIDANIEKPRRRKQMKNTSSLPKFDTILNEIDLSPISSNIVSEVEPENPPPEKQKEAEVEDTIETVLDRVDSLYLDYEKDLEVLLEQVNISKEPVVDAILMIEKTYEKSQLLEKLPSSLRAILHDSIRSILSRQELMNQAFRRKESQYIRTLFQISEKLSKMNDENILELNKKAELNVERDRIIDHIGNQFKTLRQNIIDLEDSLEEKKDANAKLQEEKVVLGSTICEIFEIQTSDNLINDCKEKIKTISNEYANEIERLNHKIATLESSATAVEARITGLSQENNGTLYDKLDKLQDKTEKISLKQKNMEDEIISLKNALQNVAAILDNRNDMDDDESMDYISDFCEKHGEGVRVINTSKLDLLFSRFLDYNSSDPFEEILEKIIKKLSDLPQSQPIPHTSSLPPAGKSQI